MRKLNKKEKAIDCTTNLVGRLNILIRRTLHPLSAKVYFYYARAYELTQRFDEIRR